MKRMCSVFVAIVVVIGCIYELCHSSTLMGVLYYVSEERNPSDYEDVVYRVVEYEMKDGTQRILYESRDKVVILHDNEKNVYAAQCMDGGLVTVWRMMDGDVVWNNDISVVSGRDQLTLLTIQEEQLIYCMESYVDDEKWISVFKQHSEGQPVLQFRFQGYASSAEIMHLTLSQQGGLAYVRREKSDGWNENTLYYARDFVYLHHDDEEIFIGEGSYPMWVNDTNLYYVQEKNLMWYDLTTKELKVVKANDGSEVVIRQRDLYATPSLTQCSDYLVYAINRDMSESLPQNQAICVLSLKDGSKCLFNDLDSIVENVSVTAVFEE